MGQIVVRRIEDTVKEALRLRAKRHGVSMEEEVRSILREAAENDARLSALPQYGLGTQIANLFRGIDWGDEVLERLPDTPPKPVEFD